MYYYKKFFIIFIMLSLILLISICILNYYIDEGNQFHYENIIEMKIAKMLLNNKSAMVQTNYNDRILQKEMMARLVETPKILILGSSHTMPISHEIFNTKRFYNASVSSGYLEDDIALYYSLNKQGRKPHTIIICLDPWIINKKFATLFGGDNIELWKSSFPEDYFNASYILFNLKINHLNLIYEKINGLLEKYSQLMSLDLVKGSFRQIKKYGWTKDRSDSIIKLYKKDICLTCYIKNPDGSVIPSLKDEALTKKQVDAITENMLALVSVFYQNFPPIDNNNKYIFENFIHYLTNQNIQIIFYFPPLEPIAYKKLFESNTNYNSIKLVERYFNALSIKYHIQVIGSYDPKKLGLNSDDFIDMWHLKVKGVRKIFNKPL